MTNFSVCVHFGYNIHEYRKAIRQRLTRCEHRSTITWGLNEIGIGVITGGKKRDGESKKKKNLLVKKNPMFLVQIFIKIISSKSFSLLTQCCPFAPM